MSAREIAELEAVRRKLVARGFRPEPTPAAEQAALPLSAERAKEARRGS